SGLVVAHAGVDENRVMARAYQECLNRQNEVSGDRIQSPGLHPGPMPCPVVVRGLRKETQRIELCTDGLDDAPNDDLTHGMLRHGTVSIESRTSETAATYLLA